MCASFAIPCSGYGLFTPRAGQGTRFSVLVRAAGGVRAAHVRVAAGRATFSYTPPTAGRWRATATYDGTRGTAPSAAGFVRMLVAGPLHE